MSLIMNLKKYEYLVLRKDEKTNKKSVTVEVTNLRDENYKKCIAEFTNAYEAKEWINKYYRKAIVLPLAMFSDEYLKVFEEISLFLREKIEEQKLLLLLPDGDVMIKNILLVGITIDTEKEGGSESVYAINHHFYVETDSKVYLSHLIVYDCPSQESIGDRAQFKSVIPYFQNGSYFHDETKEFIVDIRDENSNTNPFTEAILRAGGIGKETLNKINENADEDRELASFLEKINYPQTLKYETSWVRDIKDAYFNMYSDFILKYK